MTNKSKKILSEISAGELLDKISILEIKLDKIKNNNDLEEISKEYKLLKEVQDSNIKITEKIKKLFKEIKEVNLSLWDIENGIRTCEKNKDFGKKFTDLSRAVYLNNDKRSIVKKKINLLTKSHIVEEKLYKSY